MGVKIKIAVLNVSDLRGFGSPHVNGQTAFYTTKAQRDGLSSAEGDKCGLRSSKWGFKIRWVCSE